MSVGVKLGLSGEEAIYQSIRTILLTEKGSIPFRPRMGVGSLRNLDSNTDRMDLSLEIIDQLNTYEPRINVKQVFFRSGDTPTELRIGISYTILETGEESSYFYGTKVNN